jgi:hypothetical protein
MRFIAANEGKAEAKSRRMAGSAQEVIAFRRLKDFVGSSKYFGKEIGMAAEEG